MTFISYSQNYEDVMLWRALKHVTHGFYVDIGAWSPDVDSVTKAFYEAGWHGINVEPNPEFYGLLVQKRTKDINLQFAVSDTSGEQEMTFLSDLGSGMSTLDSKIAQRHHDAGWQCTKQMVQVTTLAKLWKENVLTGQDVHFLKVDVEGFEGAVLQGNDWTCFRPWIIVVEATLPMVQIESHEPWEGILLQHGYRFTYADGLNRFYVAEERHSELFYSFKYPPNVFDDFILVRQVLADAQAKSAQEHLQETQEHLQETLARAERVEANVHECNNELIRVYQSNSWQITKPLRWINRKLRRFWH
jgi:methyltransferase, FkbM family